MNIRKLVPCFAIIAGLLSATQAFATYKQFVVIKINAPSSTTVSIKGAHLDWGKFHKEGNKDTEIDASEINTYTIAPGGTLTISS